MKKIALINDLSGFGRCSLTAAISVISALRVQACPLPTAILSAQTGFDSYYSDDYTNKMNHITDEWIKMGESFDGIYSGYLGSDTQMENVIYFLEKFHLNDTIYLCDPVMGDNGCKFPIFTPKLLEGMKILTRKADVITPNLTELCLLGDVDFGEVTSYAKIDDYRGKIVEVARELIRKAKKRQTVIVTGIISHDNSMAYIGNLAVTEDDFYYEQIPYTGKSFSGTGDLFASVIAGCIVKGIPVNQAIDKAVEFLKPAIEEASMDCIDRNHGVYFEKYLGVLI